MTAIAFKSRTTPPKSPSPSSSIQHNIKNLPSPTGGAAACCVEGITDDLPDLPCGEDQFSADNEFDLQEEDESWRMEVDEGDRSKRSCTNPSSLVDVLHDETLQGLLRDYPALLIPRDLDLEMAQYDWSSLPGQLLNRHHLGERDRSLLGAVYRKCYYERADGEPGWWNRQRQFHDYDARATIIARSRFEKKVAFCLCGYGRYDKRGYYCHQVRIGPRCHYHFRLRPILDEFGRAYRADREVWFVTLSLTRQEGDRGRFVYKDLEPEDWKKHAEEGAADVYDQRAPALPFDLGLDYCQCQVYLGFFQRIMKESLEPGWCSGAVGAPEVAVWFRPLSVLPHAHYVMFTDGFSEDRARDIRRRLKQMIRNSRRITDKKLYPSTAFYRLPTRKDYIKALRYCFKPVAVEVPYRLALAVGEPSPRWFDGLNEDTNRFLEVLEGAFFGVNSVHRLGICQPCNERYCGFVTEERQQRRDAERKRRQEKKSEGEVALSRAMRCRRGLERKTAKVEIERALRRMEVPIERGQAGRSCRHKRRRRPQSQRSG